MAISTPKRVLNMLFVSAYSLASTFATADDTEIFFAGAQNNATKPNILFILDTSGSMGSLPAGAPSGSPNKLNIMKDAMSQILSSVTDVNVALARYTVPGGPIIYPMSDIDAPASPLAQSRIKASTDDAEEAENGSVNLVSTDLDILEETGHAKWVGLRFKEMNIPQGAKIESATISLTSAQIKSGYLEVDIYGQNADNPGTFTNTTADLSSRPLTSASVKWKPDDHELVDTNYSSEDISSIVEEIVGRSGWCGGNSIVILMKRSDLDANSRIAHSYDGDASKSAELRVKFSSELKSGATGCVTNTVVRQVSNKSDDTEQESDGDMDNNDSDLNLTNNNTIGLRFIDLNIPNSAVISEAKLEFAPYDNSYTGDTTVKIQAINTDNFGGFGSNKLSSFSKTSGSNVVYGNMSGTSSFHAQTGSFTNELQTIVNKASWKANNDIGLVLTYQPSAATNKRFRSRDNTSSYQPKLTVKFQGQFQSGIFTVRDKVKNSVNGLKANGWTPISDTLLEAGLYFRGEDVKYGTTRQNNASNLVSHPESYSGGVHNVPTGCSPELDPYNTICASENISGNPKYISPITDTCAANHIVFLTDGEPTWHSSFTSTKYGEWSGATCTAGSGQSDNAGSNGDDCTIKIAKFLSENDNSSLPGTQTITSHFIGFDISLPFLNEAANAGKGLYVEANDTQTLVNAFTQIIDKAKESSGTFVSAGVTVNQTNRLRHLDQLYFSIFGPSLNPRWPGNLKRYRFNSSTNTIVDVNDAVAVDSGSDQFVSTAVSWWTPSADGPDGNAPAKGGAASQLTSARKIYTNISGATSNVTIAAAGNLVGFANESSFSLADLSAGSTLEKEKLLRWAEGQDVDDVDGDSNVTEARKALNDPLHSRPTLVRWKDGATEINRIFVGNNFGTLNAFDTATGQEKWAFIPKELLTNIKKLRDNTSGESKPYGIDGSPVVYIDDTNKDGAINPGEKAFLYIGMRRGGTSYFAFDISSADAPKLVFQIKSGGDFTKMGYTFATPVVGKVKIGASEKLALIFPGGYDTKQDDKTITTPVNDTMGNALYIADALTGAKIWSSDDLPALSSLMTNGISAEIAAIDLDGNGRIDHIYFADMRANLFRVDIKGDGSVVGGKLAELQPSVVNADTNRRVSGGIDVALATDIDNEQYLAVALGTGHRENPLEEVIQDQFYVVRDYGVFNNQIPDLITHNELTDITDIAIGDTDDDGVSQAQEAIEAAKKGWILDFTNAGEKVTSPPVIFDNIVFFSTYTPEAPVTDGCSTGVAGAARFYSVALGDGGPVIDQDGNGLLTGDDRSLYLGGSPTAGMVPVQILFTDNGIAGLLGNQVVEIPPISESLRRVKWRHNTN